MSHISPSAHRARTYRLIDATANSSRPQPVVTAAAGGCYLRVQGPCVPRETRQTWIRGIVTKFSSASRKRLLDTLAKVDQTQITSRPIFVTLTYPGEYSPEPGVWKRDLDTWFKRFRRAYPKASAVWRLEFQARGAPHFHLLVFNVKWIDKGWLSGSWYAVVGSGDKRHAKAGTRVEHVRSWRGVMWYASKYMAKKTQSEAMAPVGRLWGVHNKAALPMAVVTFSISLTGFWRLKRTSRQWLQAKARNSGVRRPITTSNVWCRGLTLLAATAQSIQLLRVLCSAGPG